ncbi:MAG: NADH-quinone oxidoreductase subunit H [Nitrospinae bacterium]|nr:NADH-quinone oxidoreductase subunit H [Nitrospinota bacterium]
MDVSDAFLMSAQFAVVLSAPPMFVAWIRMLKCWSQGRASAGLFQPYRDIIKLFGKEATLAENASPIFRMTPYIVFGATLTAGMLIPTFYANLPFSSSADVIALVAIFALTRFFIALAGMDVGTAFGGMGSSREMMISALAEPAMLMVVFTLSLVSKSTSISNIVQSVVQSGIYLRPSMIFALLAFVLVVFAETGRIPVDNPATHLELTMIHEGMILEYSGWYLALMEWAHMMKVFILCSLGLALFFPYGISLGTELPGLAVSLAAFAFKMAAIGVMITLMETGLAKMRIFRVPEFLGSAFIFATIGMISFFTLE